MTPAEVLVAIHDINPEKDRVALKKVCLFLLYFFNDQVVLKKIYLLSAFFLIAKYNFMLASAICVWAFIIFESHLV